jgi:hypothetical protein
LEFYIIIINYYYVKNIILKGNIFLLIFIWGYQRFYLCLEIVLELNDNDSIFGTVILCVLKNNSIDDTVDNQNHQINADI